MCIVSAASLTFTTPHPHFIPHSLTHIIALKVCSRPHHRCWDEPPIEVRLQPHLPVQATCSPGHSTQAQSRCTDQHHDDQVGAEEALPAVAGLRSLADRDARGVDFLCDELTEEDRPSQLSAVVVVVVVARC